MKLKQLHIYTSYVQTDCYEGSLTFQNQTGEIQLKLSPALSTAILAIVANELVASARSVARELTAECINAALPPDERTPALSAVRDELS